MSFRQYRPSGFSILPPVVKNIIIINVIMFLATVTFGNSENSVLIKKLALYYWGSPNFEPYQFITYMFMHGGISHIFFNMFALWMFGNVLENVWGSKRFLIYYMATGLGAALTHMIYSTWGMVGLENAISTFSNSPTLDTFRNVMEKYSPDIAETPEMLAFVSDWAIHPDQTYFSETAASYLNQLHEANLNMPTVGASGSVFGILLAFGMLFPNTELMLLFPPIPIKAKYFVLGYGAIELYMGMANNPGDNVAHFAHLGGMIFGFILIKVWNNRSNKHFY